MASDTHQARLEDALERIEDIILPCIAMMIETLLEVTAGSAPTDPKALAAELRTLGAELEILMRSVEFSSQERIEAGTYRVTASS